MFYLYASNIDLKKEMKKKKKTAVHITYEHQRINLELQDLYENNQKIFLDIK